MATKEKPKKTRKCTPKYDPDMLESCDGTHYDDGRPCKKCTDDKWPHGQNPRNPCCNGQKPPERSDYPNLTDDQFGRLVDQWYEFRDQYCPVYVDPPGNPDPPSGPPSPPEVIPPVPPKSPRPDPDPPFGTGGTMSNYTEPGGDRSMEILYPDRAPGPFGTGNWAL